MQDLSGSKRPTEKSFRQKLMKTNRAFPKACDYPVTDHEEPNISVRGSPFGRCKVWRHSKNAPQHKDIKSLQSFFGDQELI